MSGGALAARTAVVTGGGRGIGAAVARALAARGARIVVAARTVDQIEAIAAELRAGGAEAWALPCDVAEESSVRALGRAVRERLSSADVLVNNAGISSSAPFHKLTLGEWNNVMGVIATGTFLCTREFLPGMRERGWGRVVNVASVVGLRGARYIAHYAAAKHAVIGLTRSLALEVAGSGVTVNAVCPGYVDTPMTEQTLANVQERAGLDRDEALGAVLRSSGQHRLVSAEEVAAVVVGFCDAGSEERNGELITIEGGAEPA